MILVFAFVLFALYVLPFMLVLVFASVFSLSILESYSDAHALVHRYPRHRGDVKPLCICALLCRAMRNV